MVSPLSKNAPHFVKLLSGPFLAFLIYAFFDLSPGNPAVTKMAAVTVWMAVWWLTEVVHLAVTSLLPLILLPVLGIADSKIVSTQYMDNIIFLFIGGFIIAFAIERWGLHQRIALKILMTVGTKPLRILLGVMLTAYLISMWISNTATVMMLLSAVFAVIYQIEQYMEDQDHKDRMATALLIGLAYAATIGGMGTLVGTPTNMIFIKAYTEAYPHNADMNFTQWFVIAFPISFVLLLAAYLVIKLLFIKKEIQISIDRSYFSEAYRKLGKASYEEKVVGFIFSITAVLWFTRANIDFGGFRFPGWINLFGKNELIHDSTVAIFMAFLLFIIPSREDKKRALITWQEASRLPVDIILLFGSGFALAKGFEISGLSNWLASHLKFLNEASTMLIILGICILVALISEFASNVASIQLVIPILIAIQKEIDIHPLFLMVPATMAASLGFALPVATAPNTIVFGSKRIRVNDMVKAGIILDLVGISMITLAMVISKTF